MSDGRRTCINHHRIRESRWPNERNTFTELANAREGIATNVLANRLGRLEENGIVTKKRLPGRGNPTRYDLTEKGLDLLPVLVAIAEWTVKHDVLVSAKRRAVLRRKCRVLRGPPGRADAAHSDSR